MHAREGNPGMIDILASEKVRDDAGIDIGEIKGLKKALKNSSKKEQYGMKQQKMELIREEGKHNCRKKQYYKGTSNIVDYMYTNVTDIVGLILDKILCFLYRN